MKMIDRNALEDFINGDEALLADLSPELVRSLQGDQDDQFRSS